MLLKGALRLIDGLYPDDGWRMLRDLDLLIPESAVAKAIRELESAGYASSGSENAVRRRGGLCQIDLHSELFSGSTQLRLLQAGTVLNGSSSFAMEQWSVRIPSIEDQLVHLIGHSQIRHRGYAMGKIGFRDLLEAAALVQWGRQSIDWRAVSARFDAAGYHRPLLAFLLALNEVPWCTVPAMGRIDDLTALQQYRIRVQARSGPFGYIGSRAGWWLSEFRSQIRERDAGQLRAIKNLRRLVSEPGAISRMAQAFCDRKADLMHILPPLILLCAP